MECRNESRPSGRLFCYMGMTESRVDRRPGSSDTGISGQDEIKLMCQIFAGQHPDRYETVTRRLRLNGQSTSIRLERAFWHILDRIAAREGVTTPAFISKLHAEVLELHGEARNFTSLLRCACTIHLGEDDVMPAAIAAE